jgi:hypothetical protein
MDPMPVTSDGNMGLPRGLRSPVKMTGAQGQPGKPLPKIIIVSRFYGNVAEESVREG